MLKLIEKSKCTGCAACVNKCPQRCITMQADDEGFAYPNVESAKCIDCGACKKACPVLRKTVSTGESLAYGGYNVDERARERSSSGGVFFLLAKYILENGGIVFGAAFTENFSVKHIKIESIAEIEKLMTSKYVQSEIGETYQEAKKYLEEGRLVLFTGTPCQIEGLRAYLNRAYPNLYLQDLICHGAPSPAAWEVYLRSLGETPIEGISFRDKTVSWKRFSVNISPLVKNEHARNSYMQAFLHDLILRPSCYQCAFKTPHRNADITLADFWGCETSDCAELDDDRGLSLIITHSKKGEALLTNIKPFLRLQETDLTEAVQRNPNYLHSAKKRKKRKEFFARLRTTEFETLVKETTKTTFTQRMKARIIKLIRG